MISGNSCNIMKKPNFVKPKTGFLFQSKNGAMIIRYNHISKKSVFIISKVELVLREIFTKILIPIYFKLNGFIKLEIDIFSNIVLEIF